MAGVSAPPRMTIEVRVVVADRGQEGAADRRVLPGHAVEDAVRFDVDQLRAGGAGERAERPDLIGDVILQLLRRDVDPAATEAEQVGQGNVRADVGADLLRQPDDTAHDRRVAAVEPGRDIRGRHQRQDAGVVAQRPAPKPFAHVAVDVDLVSSIDHVRPPVSAPRPTVALSSSSRFSAPTRSPPPRQRSTARKWTISPGLPWPTTPISLLMTVAILA